MFRERMRAAVITAALLTIAGSAGAHVLDKQSDKARFKLRADVGKQIGKFTSCVAKATLKCEKSGTLSAAECDPVTGAVSYEVVPGTATAAFQAALTKCADKIDLTKKGTDYTGIGCPGDCNPAAGTQTCADLPAYEALTSTRVRSQFNSLAAAVDAACSSAGAPDSEARIDCVDEAAKQLTKYAVALHKCEYKCEVDEKGKKGGGSLTNAGACLVSASSSQFAACESKAAEKLTTPEAIVLRLMVASMTDDVINNLFNRSDPTDPAAPAGALSPCGTCGNGAREGAEVCDGSALGTCTVCAADCTCAPPVCGNDIIEGSEACDGTALGSCLVCANDCTCAPPECGNNIIEGSEACDGTALGTCDACAGDCTCAPLAVCGNNIIEGDEDCDGTDLGACDACAVDCTCTAAVCGNNVIEGDEECDGTALGTCSACANDCSCIIDPILDGPAGTFCTTALSAATADYQPLCVPTAGSGRHIRVEGAQTVGQNGFFYLAMGFPAVPSGNPATTVGDGRFIFTGGKSQSCAYAWTYFRYSGITDPAAAALCTTPSIFGEYPNGPQTVCMDVTGDNPPRVTFWATGANGADCKNAATLTAATALYSKNDWVSANNQPVNTTTHFFKLSNASLATATSAAVSSNTVLP